ncbi:hypothetical protein NDU88_004514 [Pleurodeles waltl]|uniref:Uncharacterized protein n=1 Tax=Pleurodeles waltl TaxID=8319 RepID=A0AAV7UFI7_PLEWA|nr:hypothetical protein NDU88_004514 [Pleurodeles waltl]
MHLLGSRMGLATDRRDFTYEVMYGGKEGAITSKANRSLRWDLLALHIAFSCACLNSVYDYLLTLRCFRPLNRKRKEKEGGGVASQRVCPPEVQKPKARSVALKPRGTAARVPAPRQGRAGQGSRRWQRAGESDFSRGCRCGGGREPSKPVLPPPAHSNARHTSLTSRR